MRTWPAQITPWILLLALILDLSSASSLSADVMESSLNYHDNDAVAHYIFKRRLGVRLPNILRGDHRVTKRRLGVRLPNILFQRDDISKKNDESF
ncbi:nlp-19 [Pristionchus pacificus]|uniref:Uncharacterized protein n=1 Tax=Pristionchus pacificus TaxID=54126 RepID=A0A2A6BF91_PRIPA|nr:nlp-19 [Pristionchus pacificus]|eukprot:PDM64552.1 hypothetical protein PRIPAC_52808 [Pristionchus pacificus]